MANQAERIARDTYEREGWSVIKDGAPNFLLIREWKGQGQVC